MRAISKFLLTSIVGVSVYLTIHKLFPEKIKSFDKDPILAVKSGIDSMQQGGANEINEIKLFTRILRALMRDKALKLGLLQH